MIGLNLLPPPQQEALRARLLYAMIERIMVALVLVSLLSTSLLVLAKARLARALADAKARQILTSEYATANETIKTLDRQIARVSALQKMAVSPSSLLQDIAERTPPGVAVASLGFNAVTGRMDMAGIAARREDLLAYEQALRASPFVKQLESPITNLLRKTDADFRFIVTLNIEMLKKAYGSPL